MRDREDTAHYTIPEDTDSIDQVRQNEGGEGAMAAAFARGSLVVVTVRTADFTRVAACRHSPRCFFASSSSPPPHDAGTAKRRRTLVGGRSHRKWKKRIIQQEKSGHPGATSSDEQCEDGVSNAKDRVSGDGEEEVHWTNENHPNYSFVGRNLLKERYILEQSIRYPRTLAGWKIALSRAWEKYLWTHEGFLIAEKRRDVRGNILPDDEKMEDDGDGVASTVQDRAAEAASQVSSNVQKNVETLKDEAPKLLKMGQQLTGISTKEQLREWASDQLKLATECLGEFMNGYRKGRDDEVDRMLHKYFQEIEDITPKEDGGQSVLEMESDENNGAGPVAEPTRRSKRRKWGRHARRRGKMADNVQVKRNLTQTE